MRSVVLAACNGTQFIGAQLDSIASQLGPDDEIIVSDDASSDATVDTVLEKNDMRVTVLENVTRLGYVKNFERAISRSCGEHVFFSDQDDIWLPDKVAVTSAALKRNPCVFSDAVIVNQDLLQIHPSYFKWRGVRSFSFLSTFFRPCFIGATMACTRSYLETLLPVPPGIPHDFWISLNAAWDRKLEVIERPLILYRRHASAISTSATTRKRPRTTIARERVSLAINMLLSRLR